jgi:DNA modification methylase
VETEVIYCDDNLRRLAMLPPNSVDLIYLDPPFFSNRHYEVIWGDEAEVRSFEDRWEGGVNHYVEWMRDRVMEMWRVLKPTGSFYLHCDWHAVHHLRVMLDDVLGAERFLNEIIWCYTVGGKSKRHWARKHDTILFYAKGPDWYFDGLSVGTKRETGTKSFGGKIGVDSKGRRYQDKLVKATGKYYRYHLDEPKIPEDWWVGINSIQSQAAERLGYPTQKPEALLERIIRASSREGDVVLDPFCGCGTTLVVAHRFKRHWVGIDISPTACNLMKRRLAKVGALQVKLIGMPTTVEDLKTLKPFEFQNWIVDRINGLQSNKKSGDMGIDGWTFMVHDPIQIKQSESVGRNVIDNFETAVSRTKKQRGFIVAFSFTRGAFEEVARAKHRHLEIHLVTVDDLLQRLDEFFVLSGMAAGLPGLEAAPLPKMDARRRSAEELVQSQAKGR